MKTGKSADPYSVPPEHPLADEHAAVSAWVEDAVGSHVYYEDVELKAHESGQKLLGGSPERSRRVVLAALEQVRHWDRQADGIKAGASSGLERINAHHLPGWDVVWGRRRQAAAVINALTRRKLPFQRDDLATLLDWCNEAEHLSTYHYPLGPLVRALERHAEANPPDEAFLSTMSQFAERLRSSHDKSVRTLATRVEQLRAAVSVQSPSEEIRPVAFRPAPGPAPAGHPAVLRPLKRLLGMDSNEPGAPTTEVGPDRFPLAEDSPFPREHERLSEFFEEVVGTRHYYQPRLQEFASGRALLAEDPRQSGRIFLAAAERHVQTLTAPQAGDDGPHTWQARSAGASLIGPLSGRAFETDRRGVFDLLLYLSVCPQWTLGDIPGTLRTRLVRQVGREAEQEPLTEGERYVLWLLRTSLLDGPSLGSPSAKVAELTNLIGDGANFYLASGEAWSDAVNADLTALGPAAASKWADLFRHALTATASRPSGKWLKTGKPLLEAIGGEAVQEALHRWFPLVAKGRSVPKFARYSGDTRGPGDVMNEENATCLRGLLWLVKMLPRPDDLTHELSAVAVSAYKKVPGIGPRAVKVGNAAVYALSELGTVGAVGQLAMLKVRIKFGTAQKEIEKAFASTAEALGLPADRIEEMGVPSHGMEEVGLRSETFGDYRADLRVNGSDARVHWFDSKGKALKSVPAKVKSAHKDDLKELQQALKDVRAMLPAQRDRLDSMFLLQKSWPIGEWSELYRDHPLVGTIARRLIWRVDGTPVLFHQGEPTDVEGSTVSVGDSSRVSLWHPIECAVDEVLAWRGRLEDLGITQPFKQAHREVYPLTDAERRTRSYSNRFAAHILRQHQFNALCAARGWKNKLRLMVDDSYPPATRDLPDWGLRAEFWVEGIGEEYGEDTNDSGVYLRIATDQVRFYRTGAATNWAHAGGGGYESSASGPGEAGLNEPLPLEEVPSLVLSEILRDIDLFVGVASVGNDPTWQDGGPQGRYRQYWQDYAFGELSGSASTRKQVLERLVPRLKIADRCSFSDRFLVVRGELRTYKIHLGSGNILMEPNDQYLCIVPDASARNSQGDLFLPFEGDNGLSVILSKALLLADDKKIKDPTITRQIGAR